MNINTKTFVISDWHFGHKSIAEFAHRPANHEELIVQYCNEAVKRDDTLLFLGDLTFVNKQKTAFFTQRLQCAHKFIVYGNHDNRTDTFYRELGFTPVFPLFCEENNLLLTHEPVIKLPDGLVNIHGHIHRGDHREYNLTPNHINVSCEVLDFRPVTIGELLERHYGKNERGSVS